MISGLLHTAGGVFMFWFGCPNLALAEYEVMGIIAWSGGFGSNVLGSF